MNNVDLMGRLTKDVDFRITTGENANAVARMTVAVQRKFKNKETGKYDADFISCVAWGKTAEFIDKYFKKGDGIVINGEIRTGHYTNKEGQTIYTTDVWINNVEFPLSRSDGNNNNSNSDAKPDDSFMTVSPDEVDDMPFK